MAGKRLGKEDDRHLWPEMLRAIKEISPRYVVGENVRGLTNWNGGLVFDEVCADLENIGYQVAPFIIPACATNAPHKRERIWFVAHANDKKCNGGSSFGERKRETREQRWDGIFCTITRPCQIGTATDTNSQMLEYGYGKREAGERANKKERIKPFDCTRKWQTFPTVAPVCNGDDGIPERLDAITFSKWRQESIKAGGNAVVPQVVLQIFRTIEEYEKMNAR